MPDYRMFRLEHGRIKGRAETIKCDNDRHVIDEVRQLQDGLDVEVWDGPRLVMRLNSNRSNEQRRRHVSLS